MDTQLFTLINRGMANPLFDVLMPALTHRGYLLVVPIAVYILYRGARTPAPSGRTFFRTALAAVLLALVAFPLTDFLSDWCKPLFARPRPCQVLEGVRLLVGCSPSFSFPSGHATTSFAYALPLFLLTRPFIRFGWRTAPLAIAAAVAFSRPYVGVHYPSDVLAGALLGGGVSWLLCRGYGKIETMGNTPAGGREVNDK